MSNWTPEERAEVSKAMEKLPKAFLRHVKAIDRQEKAPGGPGHSSYDPNNGSLIYYDKGVRRQDGTLNKKQIQESLYHEVAHSLEKEKGLIDAWCQRVGWIRGSRGWSRTSQNKGFVYTYGKRDPFEDFATSFAMYFTNPKRLAKVSPDKFRFIAELVIKNSGDKQEKKAEMLSSGAPTVDLEFTQGEKYVPPSGELPKSTSEKQIALQALNARIEERAKLSTTPPSEGAYEKTALMVRNIFGGFRRSGILGTKPDILRPGGITKRLRRLTGGIAKEVKQEATGTVVGSSGLT